MTLYDLKQQIDALLAARPALALSPVEYRRARVTAGHVRRDVVGVEVKGSWQGSDVVALVAGEKVFS